MEQNSRVRVGDVTVGNVTKIERQGWHALVTMRARRRRRPAGQRHRDDRPDQPAGFAAHRAGAADAGVAPEGRLHDGSLIPLSSGSAYPTTEQTLAAVSMLLNGGGLGQLQDITTAFSTAFAGREQRPAQPDDPARPVHRPTPTTKPTTSSPPPTASTTWSASSPRRSRWSTGRCRPSPTRWPCSASNATTWPRHSTSSASSARWPPTRSTRPRTRWSRSSTTSGRCWNRWPMPVRR